MRINSAIKIHEAHGPRLPFPIKESEIRENEYEYASANAIMVNDGEGILYWADIVPTSDGGSGRLYDETSAAGETITAGYAAKALDGQLKRFDPPVNYKHGIYAALTTAVCRICYKPIARNLRCTVTVSYAPGTKNLVCRITVVYISATKNLVCRLTVAYAGGTKDLLCKLTVLAESTKDLVIRTTTLKEYAKDLQCQLTVMYAPGTFDLLSKLTVLRESSKDLVCNVTIPYAESNKWLYCQVTVTH